MQHATQATCTVNVVKLQKRKGNKDTEAGRVHRTWRHGYQDIETWVSGQRHGYQDIETWVSGHRDVGIRT